MTDTSFRRYLITIIVCSLIIAGLLGVFWWLSRKITASRAALEESQNRVVILEDQRSQARILAGLLKKRAHDLDRIRNVFIVDRKRPIAFIDAMEALAQGTGTSIKMTIDPNNKDPQVLGFQAVIAGSETGLRTMLRAVELAPYQISIDNLIFQDGREAAGGIGHAVRTLSGNGGNGDSATLTLTLLVKAL